MKANAYEINHIESLYKDRKPFYGDMHNHAKTGGTSDGRYTLSEWHQIMDELGMDFAGILDHRQVRHMYLPEWEDGVFLGGSEAGTVISDSTAVNKDIHYNMIFENSKPLEKLLHHFEEFEFEGGAEGHFSYPHLTRKRMGEIIDFIKENGGFFVHPHPKLCMESDDPLQYWFSDETGIEVIYNDLKSEHTKANYKLWCELLKLGRRVWACSGEDRHYEPTTDALTVIYAEEKTNKSYLSYIRNGDFVCGSVGIKMCIEDTLMGGICDFGKEKLIVSVNDFHKSVLFDDHKYFLELYNEDGFVCSEEIVSNENNTFSFEIEDCLLYRAEVYDETEKLCIAYGNPIWNLKKYNK